MNNIIFVVVVCFVAFLFGCFYKENISDDIHIVGKDHVEGFDRDTIRCAYVNYPPYLNVSPNDGSISGIMVDVMDEIANKSGLSVEWIEEVNWTNMMEGLKLGRYDAVCSSIWKNSKRAVNADFSMAIGYSPIDILVRGDDYRFDNHILNINSKDIKISTIDGEMTEMIADDLFPNAGKFGLAYGGNISDALLNVKNGKADAIFVERKIANEFMKHNPDSLKNISYNKEFLAFPITIMVGNGSDELLDIINASLEEIVYTQKISLILANYDLDDKEFLLSKRPY